MFVLSKCAHYNDVRLVQGFTRVNRVSPIGISFTSDPSVSNRPKRVQGLLERDCRFSGGGNLSAQEQQVWQRALSARPVAPVSMMLFTDANNNADDLAALIPLAQLQDSGFVRLAGVIAGRGRREVRLQRAQFVKHVLNELGLDHVPVAVGGTYRGATQQGHQNFLTTPFDLSNHDIKRTGMKWMREQWTHAPDQSLVLLVISGVTDVAAIMENEPDLFSRKVKQVVVMGGLSAKVDADGWRVPDKRASNNAADYSAARKLFQGLQQQNIPLLVLNKEAAYAASVAPDFFSSLRDTGHMLGQFLHRIQKESLRGLWQAISRGLRDDLTTDWFQEQFTSLKRGLEKTQGDFEAIWQRVDRIYLYDPITVLAAVPGIREMLFSPKSVNARGTLQLIDGESVSNPDDVRHLLTALGKQALTES